MTCWPFATSWAWTAIGLILFTRRDRSADWGSPESMISKADRKRARRGERNLNFCALVAQEFSQGLMDSTRDNLRCCVGQTAALPCSSTNSL
jgi:hypothetical protein